MDQTMRNDGEKMNIEEEGEGEELKTDEDAKQDDQKP